VRCVQDPSEYDALFVEALAARLAFESCETLTNSNTKKQALWEEYLAAMGAARRANAIERPALTLPDDSWLQARL
jgi:hypothetical protein